MWIVRELSRLKNLIDRANEKGWRRELFDYLERQQLLQKQSEQARLLLEVPKVIAEVIEPEVTVAEVIEPEVIVAEDKENAAISENKIANFSTSATGEAKENQIDGSFLSTSQGDKENAVISETEIVNFNISATGETKENFMDGSFLSTSRVQEPNRPAEINKKGVEEVQHTHLGNINFVQKVEKQVIYLSDDEEEDNVLKRIDMTDKQSESDEWYYMDPQGDEQGPFPLHILKTWSDLKYFPPDFKVWKTGQNPVNSVLLSDLLQFNFPG